MRFAGLTLFSDDAVKARDFYVERLGFRFLREERPMPDCVVEVVERDGFVMDILERVGAPAVVHNAFSTTIEFDAEDIELLYEEMKGSSVRMKSPLRRIGPEAMIFEIYGPDSYPITFMRGKFA